MNIFLDTADENEIKRFLPWGCIDGVTTNPSLIAASGRKREDVIAAIADLVSGPISAEVIGTDTDAMVDEGRQLSKIAPQVVIKVPLTADGLAACNILSQEAIDVNVTLCFSAAQAILAAKAGAAFISPFVGRLDDQGEDGMELIEAVTEILEINSHWDAQVLAASIRSPYHVVQAARMGAHVCTVPPKVLDQMLRHPLTDIGLDKFLADYRKSTQAGL